jgi:hypothetical protein
VARNKKGKAPAKPTKPDHSVAHTPPRNFKFDPNLPEVREIAAALPPGLFGIVANESARYTVFTGHVLSLVMPNHSRYAIHTGCYVVDSCNKLFDSVAEHEDWVMIMGDDHQFPPELILKLLSLMYRDDLDIIVPVCFKRDFPPTPVLYKYEEVDPALHSEYAFKEGEPLALVPINLNDYPNGGLIEVDGAGSAGMVVRKRVMEAMEPPWFRLGVGHWGEDLDFCRRAQELGFKIHADLDMSLGHIVNTCLWPVRNQHGEWSVEYDFGGQGGFVLGL